MNENGPRSVQFGVFDNTAAPTGGSTSSIDLLRNVPLEVKAELGRAQRLVQDILRLNVGSVIDLAAKSSKLTAATECALRRSYADLL